MKTQFVLSVLSALLVPFFALSQVGIGTVSPNAQLDIQSSNQAAPANNDGILIPKIDEFPAVDPGANQDGMMVYATGSGSVARGFYYWNNTNTNWVQIVGNSGAIEKLNDLSDAKSDDDGTDDGSSVFLGTNAGLNDDLTDNRNAGVGFSSLSSITSGFYNTALGYNSLLSNTTGIGNVAVGYDALANSTANYNTAIGFQSLPVHSNSQQGNTAVGMQAMFSSTGGASNTAVGQWALRNNVSGNSNSAFGASALRESTTGFGNVAVGVGAGRNVNGNSNVFIGRESGYDNSTLRAMNGSVFIGANSGRSESSSNRLYIENSSADQYGALIYGEFDNDLLRVNGVLNINNQYSLPAADGAINQVLQTNGSGALTWVNQNSTGAQQIDELSDGTYDSTARSVYLGEGAGNSETSSAQFNTVLGYQSLFSNSVSNGNTSIGYQTMYFSTGGNNTAMGQQALSNATGGGNCAMGLWAARQNTSGSSNVSLGVQAYYDNTTGSGNVIVGGLAGRYVNGSSNVMIGSGAGNSGSSIRSMSGNVFIGAASGALETGSNKLYIENSNSSSPLVYGEFDTNLLRVNGTLDVNNQYSFPTADGTADQVMQTDGAGNLSWTTLSFSDATTASNGLTLSANDVQLGGVLSQNTTVTQGNNTLTWNLNGSGDFVIQDNGVNHFEFRDNGSMYLGGDTVWYDENTSGTQLASLFDIGDDGVFWVNNGGSPQHLINGNGSSAFNVLGLAVDFSIQGDTNTNLFYVDGSTDRIGVRIGTPSFDVHLKQSGLTEGGAGGIGLESSTSTNNWKIYHSGSFLSFAENGVRRAYIQNGTGAYIQTSDRHLKKNISEINNVLDKLESLSIYSYHYADQNPSETKTLGVMAQELQPHFPELVVINEEGDLGVNYANLSVVALKAIQEQQKIIEEHQAKIDDLSEEIKAIKVLLERR